MITIFQFYACEYNQEDVKTFSRDMCEKLTNLDERNVTKFEFESFEDALYQDMLDTTEGLHRVFEGEKEEESHDYSLEVKDWLWLENDTFWVLFGDVENASSGVVKHIEAEYHKDEKRCVIVVNYYNANGGFIESLNADDENMPYELRMKVLETLCVKLCENFDTAFLTMRHFTTSLPSIIDI